MEEEFISLILLMLYFIKVLQLTLQIIELRINSGGAIFITNKSSVLFKEHPTLFQYYNNQLHNTLDKQLLLCCNKFHNIVQLLYMI